MFEFFLVLTFLTCAAVLFLAYLRKVDMFSPALVVSGMFLFLYVYMPCRLYLGRAPGLSFLTRAECAFTQLIVLTSLWGFLIGCLLAKPRLANMNANSAPRRTPSCSLDGLWRWGLLFCIVGFVGWSYFVHLSGGFKRFYGSVHGEAGLWDETTAYLYQLQLLVFPGLVMMIQASRTRSSGRALHWALVAVVACGALLHAILTAHRGDLWAVAVVLGVTPYLARGSRPGRLAVTAAGAVVVIALLLVVGYRSELRWVPDVASMRQRPVSEALTWTERAYTGNEYVYSGAVINLAWRLGRYGLGYRYAFVFIHVVPRLLWPTKPYGLASQTISSTEIGPAFGWSPSGGACRTLVADFFGEFSFGAVVVWAIVGYVLTRIHARALVRSRLGWQAVYVLILARSANLVAQEFLMAFVEPLLFMLLPSVLVYWKGVGGDRPVRRNRGFSESGQSPYRSRQGKSHRS